MGRIILVQHCQSEHHINEMSGGWTDTPLTELGRRQAEIIAKKLRDGLDSSEYILYSSDLLRASQTAEIIGEQLGLDVNINKELREINTGYAAGKTKEWASANRNPRTGSSFDLDYQEFQNGETWRQFYRRVCDCLELLYETNKKNLLIVTHGGTLAYITAWWLQFSEQMLGTAYFSASPASISVLTRNAFNQNVLEVFNDSSHLSLLN
ncbi:putative phosphoglycerate mutase [Paenibacillus endophyticus]|uniref:Putative phosphoglycerate mutase n=1 Tax=Paenibacillus endophyticus TaxID=1294268 RepID=A0A7W5CDI6_9BACL|nr:histidine phosphatase family protein [Paenibacillus endophyticus]MBB3155220.1 putative phosphoglycerate mutase [Paenibacillus endophyticus]